MTSTRTVNRLRRKQMIREMISTLLDINDLQLKEIELIHLPLLKETHRDIMKMYRNLVLNQSSNKP